MDTYEQCSHAVSFELGAMCCAAARMLMGGGLLVTLPLPPCMPVFLHWCCSDFIMFGNILSGKEPLTLSGN